MGPLHGRSAKRVHVQRGCAVDFINGDCLPKQIISESEPWDSNCSDSTSKASH